MRSDWIFDFLYWGVRSVFATLYTKTLPQITLFSFNVITIVVATQGSAEAGDDLCQIRVIISQKNEVEFRPKIAILKTKTKKIVDHKTLFFSYKSIYGAG